MINGKAFFKPNKQNLLLAGLLALTSPAFAQSESFVIECKVSGESLMLFNSSPNEKISNQKIMVSVDLHPSEVSINIQGRGRLNIGSVRADPITLTKEEIVVFQIFQTKVGVTLNLVKINRITGFIELSSDFTDNRTKSMSMTNVEGFCQKVSNKQKF